MNEQPSCGEMQQLVQTDESEEPLSRIGDVSSSSTPTKSNKKCKDKIQNADELQEVICDGNAQSSPVVSNESSQGTTSHENQSHLLYPNEKEKKKSTKVPKMSKQRKGYMNIFDEDSSSSISTDAEIPSKKRGYRLTLSSSDESSDASSEEVEWIYSSGSDNELQNTGNNLRTQWVNPRGNQPSLMKFSGTPGPTFMDSFLTESDFYLLFVTEEMFEEIAQQTNIYAEQTLSQTQSSRLNKWVPTNKNEIKKLFGLLIWMGLVKLPELNLYWTKDPIFSQRFATSVLSRNRFKLLLRMLHFVNNDIAIVEDRLYKIKPIIDKLKENFKKYYNPPETLCIEESIIPFHGRGVFRQYMKQKRHRYDVKLFKLCFRPGFTYNFEIYCYQQFDREKPTPKAVAMSLCKHIFQKGHTLCIDNWNSSIELAEEFISRNTHIIGTIRSNDRRICKEVEQKKLERREIYAKENANGITLMKWKDKRDLLLLSTKHSVGMAIVKKRGQTFLKPKLAIDYCEAKFSINNSDQMTSYSSPLGKTVKWYKKVAFELLLNTCVTNAWILNNSLHSNKISIFEFRKKLVNSLCFSDGNSLNILNENAHFKTKAYSKRHELKQQEGIARKVRRRCSSCYKINVKKFGSDLARVRTKRITTYCNDCPKKPFLCISCFNKADHDM